MKSKTCIVLSALSLGLRALALIAVLLMTVLQEPVKRLYNIDEAALEVHTLPWAAILQALVLLILAGIILLVLLKRPRRGGTIALAVVSAVLYGVLSTLIFPAVSFALQAAANRYGMAQTLSYNALSNAMSLVLPILNTPALILSLLALGGACGKSFRAEP